MRKLIYFGTAVAVVALIALALKYGLGSSGNRGPAGVQSAPVAETVHETLVNPKTLSMEVFEFDRRIHASFGKKTLAETKYAGFLYIEWTEIASHERTGRISFKLKEGSIPSLYLMAKVSSDYDVISIEEPLIKTEEQEDVASFLKDLISIYAFRSSTDTTGKYKGTLKQVSDLLWMKKKNQYEDAKFAQLHFLKSIHQIKLKKLSEKEVHREEIAELSGLEDSQVQTGKNGDFRTHSTYLLKRIEKQRDAPLFPAERMVMRESAIQVNPQFAVKEKVNWESVRTELPQAGILTGQARLDFFHHLNKALKANPEKGAEFAQWLRSVLDNPKMANFGIGVLATAGTPEAQHELVSLYQDLSRNPEQLNNCHSILNAFTTTESKLTDESRALLTSQMNNREQQDLALNAAFAFGAALQKDPNVSDAKKLADLASQAKSSDEKMAYLDAMGNSGSSTFLPQVTEDLNSSDPTLREKAVFALRYMSGGAVQSLLESALNDPNESVRISAVKAMSFQKNFAAFQSVLNGCASQTSDPQLKAACSQTLAQHGNT